MIEICLLILAIGQPPQAPMVRYKYSEFKSIVECSQVGGEILLTVGSDYPNAIRCDDAREVGIKDGQYVCFIDNGVAMMSKLSISSSEPSPVFNVLSCPNGNCQRR